MLPQIPFSQQSLDQQRRVLFRNQILLDEQAKYPYLPETGWMKRGGYVALEVGAYECTHDGILYRLVILSQTSMALAFQNSVYLSAQEVKNDEDLLRFLSKCGFPLPA
jgi:hypothetical protein